jgi:predicted membrane metal-binding protein
MPAIDAAGFLIGAILLVAVRFVPQLISPLAFWLLLSALAAGFGVDLILWFSRGIHAIELEGDTLTLHRGHRRSVRQRVERTSVRCVRARRSWGGQVVEIRLRRYGDRGIARLLSRLVSRLLGQDRVLLRDDAFDREAFAVLTERLAVWKG